MLDFSVIAMFGAVSNDEVPYRDPLISGLVLFIVYQSLVGYLIIYIQYINIYKHFVDNILNEPELIFSVIFWTFVGESYLSEMQLVYWLNE